MFTQSSRRNLYYLGVRNAMALTLKQRAATRDGVLPMTGGISIETRGPKHSIFMRVYEDYDKTSYRLYRGVAALRPFVIYDVPIAPYRRVYGPKGWTLA